MDWFSVVFAAVWAAVFLLTVLSQLILIPILRSHKLGQRILDIGPRWHRDKNGTPIMGGLGFILSSLIVAAVWFTVHAFLGDSQKYIGLALTLAYAIGNGAIGFVDDYCKLIRKQNEGLTWRQKLFLQVVLAAAFVALLTGTGCIDTAIRLPFARDRIDLGFFFYPISILLLCGVVNGGNITDGIDGLASAVTFVCAGSYAVLAFLLRDETLSLISSILLGATLGFFLFNCHPARVFMGDTGSLFLGAMVYGTAFGMGESVVGLIFCAVFILEMLSSFLQVVYFRVTHGKRLFRMAPFHHHLEQCGWSENQIVAVFSAAELLFCVLAFLAL